LSLAKPRSSARPAGRGAATRGAPEPNPVCGARAALAGGATLTESGSAGATLGPGGVCDALAGETGSRATPEGAVTRPEVDG